MIKRGDRVQWQEGGWGQHTCTGTVLSEDVQPHAEVLGIHPNPFGHFTIKVDDESYHYACHTAYEMHSRWVSRSVELNKLRLIQETEKV